MSLLCMILLISAGAFAPQDAFQFDDFLDQPQALAVDGSGRILIAEGGAHRVLIVEPSGKVAGSFGRKGQGPGEFQTLVGIGLLADGRILVADSGQFCLHLFDAKGEFIRQIKIGEQSIGRLMVLPGDRLALTESNGRSFFGRLGTKVEHHKVYLCDLEGNRLAGWGDWETHENPLMESYLNAGALAVSGDRVLFAGHVRANLNYFPIAGGEVQIFRYPPAFEPNEPKASMDRQTSATGETSFFMRVEVDILCTAIAVLPGGDILMLRASSRPEDESGRPPMTLIRLSATGEIKHQYPDTYHAIEMALAPDAKYVYLLEERDDWILLRVTL